MPNLKNVKNLKKGKLEKVIDTIVDEINGEIESDEKFKENIKPNFDKLISDKIKEAVEMLDVTLDNNDPALIDQITLGDNWDDPFALTKAMDTQPLYYSRWATLLRKLKNMKQEYQKKYDVWESIVKENITEEIFKENIDSKMTANNAKPTNSAVTNRFNRYCVSIKGDMHKEYLKMRSELDKINDRIDTVEIVVKAFEQRKDMLISLGSLVRSMVDNQLMIYRDKLRKSKK